MAHNDLAERLEGRELTKRNTGEEITPRAQTRTRVSFGLEGVRRKAKMDKGCCFTSLLHHVTPALLLQSYYSLKRNSAAGIDGVTWRDYEKHVTQSIAELHSKVHKGSYRAKPVKRVYIDKENGEQRPLGVTSLEDKIVQQAMVTVLNAIYEQDFRGMSYGFRPNRDQHMALDALYVGINRKRVNWLLDVDISGFFDAISHEQLLAFMKKRIGDKRVLRLINKWLKTGYVKDGKIVRTDQGTPQGGVISPLLSNIYLHYVLDEWMINWRSTRATGEVIYVRYADDSVAGFTHKNAAMQCLDAMKYQLNKYGLKLHPDKTRLLEFGRFANQDRHARGEGKAETFDFLGFTHICGKTRTGKYFLRRHTSKKRLAKSVKAVSVEIRKRMHEPIPVTGKWLALILRGFSNYYGVPGNSRSLSQFYDCLAIEWLKSLRRRSHKSKSLTWKWFNKMKSSYLPRLKPPHPFPDKRFNVRHSR